MKDPFDPGTIAAFPVERRLLEKDIQEKCVAWARARGYWARKFSSPANRSVPDYLFSKQFFRIALMFAVEFKAPGKKPTQAQLEEMNAMEASGYNVMWCDRVEDFKTYVTTLEKPFVNPR